MDTELIALSSQHKSPAIDRKDSPLALVIHSFGLRKCFVRRSPPRLPSSLCRTWRPARLCSSATATRTTTQANTSGVKWTTSRTLPPRRPIQMARNRKARRLRSRQKDPTLVAETIVFIGRGGRHAENSPIPPSAPPSRLMLEEKAREHMSAADPTASGRSSIATLKVANDMCMLSIHRTQQASPVHVTPSIIVRPSKYR